MTKCPQTQNPQEAVTAFRASAAINAVSSVNYHQDNTSEQGTTQTTETSQSLQIQRTSQQQNLLPVSVPKNKSVSPTKPPRQLNLQHKFAPQSNQQKQQQQKKPLSPAQEKQQNQLKEASPPQQQSSPGKQFKPDSAASTGGDLVVEEELSSVVHALSMPASDQGKSSYSPSKHRGMNGSVEDMEMMTMERERGGEPSPRKGKKGKKRESRGSSKASSNPDTMLIEEMASRGQLAPNGNSSNHNSMSKSAHELYSPEYDPGFLPQHSPQDSDFSDNGPHREMAIDCPDNFIATVKSPPRYPPQQPRVPPTTPSKHADMSATKDRARTDAVLNSAAMAVAGGSQSQPTPEQLDRLRRHQDELKKRREEETRQQQEQDFLRASLRGSKKLQALENRRMAQMEPQASPPAPIGIVNTAFEGAEDDDQEGEDNDEGELVDDVDALAAEAVASERYLKKNPGVEDLLSTLQHIRSRLNSADNTVTSSSSSGANSMQDVLYLRQLFHHPRFQKAVAIHQKMVEVTSRSPQPVPVGTGGQELSSEVCVLCSEESGITTKGPGFGSTVVAGQELVQLLSQPDMKNLLKAHDEVAEQKTRPMLDTSETDLIDYPLVQYGEDSVKIIHLEKTNEHLGATVKNEGDSVIIARIVNGGAAEKSGLLHEGDEILEVNGIEMRGKNVNEVSEILANMSGTITFMIIPVHVGVGENTKPGEIMHLRALFNYDPEEDEYLPCRELGLSFLKGDVLHAVQLTDPNWWQAHRDGEESQHMLAGLIPSANFHTQKETIKQQLNAEGKENKKRSRICACGRKERKKKKKKKALYNGGMGEETEEILTYEEVTQYYPQPNRKRPIVLVGPPDIGRQELRERIMESDFDRFAAAVPHTSRPPQAGEQHGKDYYFVSRSSFEADMLSGKFIECGEFQGNLYGTSMEAVRTVITQGRICILNLGPESLKVMRDTDLKPYIIFVIPPNMEKLRQLQISLGKPRPTDDQLKEVIERGREMEETYSHLFDYHLVNMSMDRSFSELMQEINRIEREPQWVPLAWLNNYSM